MRESEKRRVKSESSQSESEVELCKVKAPYNTKQINSHIRHDFQSSRVKRIEDHREMKNNIYS